MAYFDFGPEKPLSDAQLQAKFCDCAAHAVRPIAPEVIEHAMRFIRQLEDAIEAMDLVRLFATEPLIPPLPSGALPKKACLPNKAMTCPKSQAEGIVGLKFGYKETACALARFPLEGEH
jgi:hypothetical protein